jgi:hypothetical protein
MKIAFITGIILAFIGCIIDYNDNLFHNAYLYEHRPNFQWFKIQIWIGETIAIISGLILYYKKQCTLNN